MKSFKFTNLLLLVFLPFMFVLLIVTFPAAFFRKQKRVRGKMLKKIRSLTTRDIVLVNGESIHIQADIDASGVTRINMNSYLLTCTHMGTLYLYDDEKYLRSHNWRIFYKNGVISISVKD